MYEFTFLLWFAKSINMTLNRNLAEKWGGKINFIGFKKKELKELKLHGSLALPSRDDKAHKKSTELFVRVWTVSLERARNIILIWFESDKRGPIYQIRRVLFSCVNALTVSVCGLHHSKLLVWSTAVGCLKTAEIMLNCFRFSRPDKYKKR